MKRIAFTLLSIALFAGIQSFAQDDMEKRKSPPATAKAKIGDAQITINYSSPAVKGREIFGDLVPYDKIWRAGANEATTFETSADVKVNGKTLAAGKYSFFVIPNAKGKWTVIFNKDHKQWGEYKYDQSKDELRIDAVVKNIALVESLTYEIKNKKVYLNWSNKSVQFNIER